MVFTKESLNSTELDILQLLQKGHASVSEMASALSISLSWSSECISHLAELGFVSVEKEGNKTFVSMSQTAMGYSMSLLLQEEPMLDLKSVLSGSGLKVLPTVLPPGHRMDSVARRADISPRTAKGLLARWRRMGVLKLHDNHYCIDPVHKPLISFARCWAEHRNATILRDMCPGALIMWQWREEFMFTSEVFVDVEDVVPSGPTRLEELGYDIMGNRYYYYYNPEGGCISEVEAVVQTIMIDPMNPRNRKHLKNKKISRGELSRLSKKYGVEELLKEEIKVAK